MSDNDAIGSFNIDGLERLIKAMKVKAPDTRIGILGDSSRTGQGGEKGEQTNAEIGAAHELGTTTIPKRSFLKKPIADGLKKEMERSGLYDKDALKKVIKEASLVPWMDRAAICAEACVSDAFETGGNGRWPAWKTPGYENRTGQLLIDTQQLRNSVLSDVAGNIKKRLGGNPS